MKAGAGPDREEPSLRIAADIGGTFTDVTFVGEDGVITTRKVLSTPDDYARAVIEGIGQILAGLRLSVRLVAEVLHGCTVATNAILERKGARTALITTKGFRDVLELRRIRVPTLYDPLYIKPKPLVPRRLRLEVKERLDGRGRMVTPLDADDVMRAVETIRESGAESVAVTLLHSYANVAFMRPSLPGRSRYGGSWCPWRPASSLPWGCWSRTRSSACRAGICDRWTRFHPARSPRSMAGWNARSSHGSRARAVRSPSATSPTCATSVRRSSSSCRCRRRRSIP